MDGDLIYASAVGRPESDRAEARGPSEAAGSMPGRTRHGQGGSAAALRLEASAGPGRPAYLQNCTRRMPRWAGPGQGRSRRVAAKAAAPPLGAGRPWRQGAQGMSGTPGTGRGPSGRKISFLLSPSQPQPQLVFDVP